MKKALALALCLIMLLTLAVGCKKKEAAQNPPELTDSQISTDLMHSDHLYYYAHTGDISFLAGLKVTDKQQKDDTLTLKATATAGSNHIEVALAADMEYTIVNGKWKLSNITLTKADPTILSGPYQDSLVSEIGNYIAYNIDSQEAAQNRALAYYGEERHSLDINIQNVTWGIQYEEGATTAKLTAEMKSDALTFSGYYSLTFNEERGWVIESEKQDNGQNYLVLRLDSLEQKTTDEK